MKIRLAVVIDSKLICDDMSSHPPAATYDRDEKIWLMGRGEYKGKEATTKMLLFW